MIMENIPSVEEFINKKFNILHREGAFDKVSVKGSIIKQAMVDFAKLHIKAALEAASKEAKIINDPNSYTGNVGEIDPDQIVDKDSIINSYPLENIK